MTHRLVLPASLTLLLGMSACSAGSVSAEDVATYAEDALEEQVGARPDVVCPDGVEAEVGAEVRCTLTADGDPQEYGVTVTVASIDGDTARFDVRVDDEPLN